jgi:hypothetical protein
MRSGDAEAFVGNLGASFLDPHFARERNELISTSDRGCTPTKLLKRAILDFRVTSISNIGTQRRSGGSNWTSRLLL